MQSCLLVISKLESQETIRLHVLLELEIEILCSSIFRKYVASVTSSLVTQNTVLIAAEIKVKVIQLRVDKTLVRIIIIMQHRYTSVDLTKIVSYFASIKVMICNLYFRPLLI